MHKIYIWVGVCVCGYHQLFSNIVRVLSLLFYKVFQNLMNVFYIKTLSVLNPHKMRALTHFAQNNCRAAIVAFVVMLLLCCEYFTKTQCFLFDATDFYRGRLFTIVAWAVLGCVVLCWTELNWLTMCSNCMNYSLLYCKHSFVSHLLFVALNLIEAAFLPSNVVFVRVLCCSSSFFFNNFVTDVGVYNEKMYNIVFALT